MEQTHVDVLVVTALKDELDALLEAEFSGEGRSAWTEEHDRHGFSYHVRRFSNEHGEPLHVAAAWSGDMGETAAAERAGALIGTLDPGCLAMCGICAGKRGEVFLGDIIIANRVHSYDRGKHVAGSHGHGEAFFQEIETYNLEATWSMGAQYFAEEFQRSWEGARERPLSKASQRRWLLHTLNAHQQGAGPSPKQHPERKMRCPGWATCIQDLRKAGLLEDSPGELRLTPKGLAHVAEEQLLDPDGQAQEPPFRVHVAPIATGKAVKEDPELFNQLKHSARKVLGVEMEAAAIGFVAQRRNLRSLIVKAVSDYAEHDKDDSYRQFACRASAAFLLAFLGRYLRPAPSKAAPARSPHRNVLEESVLDTSEKSHDDFLSRVRRAWELNEPEGTKLERRVGPAPFGDYLEVSVFEGPHRFIRMFPVAVLEEPPTEEHLAAFLQTIHARYQRENPLVLSTLVHVGHEAPEELARKAFSKQVRLQSFAELQGLIDFSTYLRRQRARLEVDPVYPPALYVPQRAQEIVGGQVLSRRDDVLETLRELLESPGPRFALVLGDFGTGKTFLLHELARRMSGGGSALIPVLIELRSLQKQRTLRELIAQHFAAADMGRLQVDRFLYMLREGRIVLLFDGFDELALRVTYDRALEHFGTLLEAAEGEAKVIITSRTQHFLTDQDVKQELARRAETLRGYRLIKLEGFNHEQIQHFLVKRLKGDETLAGEYMELLKAVRDLLGLSENPRLLSFIAELGVDKLREARKETGEISSARLYELLIHQWIQGEHVRVNPPGAPKGLSQEELRSATTDLALLLWGRSERTVTLDELPGVLLATVQSHSGGVLETEVIKHQLGSGSLLVRDENGRFSFVHQSVMEWLVADAAASAVREGKQAEVLGVSEMSELMADFFVALAGVEPAQAWAESKIISPSVNVAQRNALRIQQRLPRDEKGPNTRPGKKFTRNLEGSDLRGQDLVGMDLSHDNLRRSNLAGVPLSWSVLTEADLREACLVGANLEFAVLDGTDLRGADLTGARLMGASLRGAKLQGAKLRAAKLVGAHLDSLEGADVFGAALPDSGWPEALSAARSPCHAVTFSRTDELLATGHEDGTVRLWDAVTGNTLRVLKFHDGPVRSVAFSPDGRTLASASADKVIWLWGVEDGQPLQALLDHDAAVMDVVFSPDGKTLASASLDGTVRLWSAADGKPLRTLEGHEGQVFSVAFSPDGTLLASSSEDLTVRLWSVTAEEPPRVLRGHASFVFSVAFSPDGQQLASSSEDRTVRVWNIADGELLRTLMGHDSAVRVIAFSPDGATVATATDEGWIYLWRLVDEEAPLILVGRQSSIRDIAFSRNGAILASVSSDVSLCLWSMADKQILQELGAVENNLLHVSFCPDGKALLSVATDGEVCLWGASGELRRSFEMFPGRIRGVALSPDGATLASASDDRTVRLWSVAEESPPRIFKGHLKAVSAVAFSPDGTVLASASDDRIVRLWSVATGQFLRSFTEHLLPVRSVAFSPDGKTLASASDDALLLRKLDGEPAAPLTLRGQTLGVLNISFSPDGTRLASASSNGTVRLWNAADGQTVRVLQVHSRSTLHVAFSPDGATLATASADGRVRLWSVANEQAAPRVLSRHSNVVRSVAFSPDGATLASSSRDGTVCLWDVATGECLATLLKLPQGQVVFRPDGSYKPWGNTQEGFWHVLGLCRFEPRELDPFFPLRLPEDEPLFPAKKTQVG